VVLRVGNRGEIIHAMNLRIARGEYEFAWFYEFGKRVDGFENGR
jgi:hypothetical protein